MGIPKENTIPLFESTKRLFVLAHVMYKMNEKLARFHVVRKYFISHIKYQIPCLHFLAEMIMSVAGEK